MFTHMKVTDLIVYPIKSCRGVHLTHAVCDERGIVNDRSLLIVDSDGLFLTQRKLPKMALIAPDITDDALTISAPAMQNFSMRVGEWGQRYKVVVWHSTCEVVDQGDAVAQWLSDFLGQNVRLVRMADAFVRKVNPDYARAETDQVGFADGYPYLLASEAALADLNRRLPNGVGALPMNRFRANIVIDGDENAPYDDDEWRDIQIGAMRFGITKPCVRCAVPTIDQKSGIPAGKEPTATLATYRIWNDGVIFGTNMIALGNQTGVLSVGDEVTVLSRK
jgi:hypothetical protein